jgi:hypothetical protein
MNHVIVVLGRSIRNVVLRRIEKRLVRNGRYRQRFDE